MTKKADTGLLPCPFCGGTKLRVQTERRDVPADAMGQCRPARVADLKLAPEAIRISLSKMEL